MRLHELAPVKDALGASFDFETLVGKVVLVVNTATNCGFSGQFLGLQELQEKYADNGFVVVGVPSNQFGEEPRSGRQMVEFAQKQWGVTFPLLETVRVNGSDAHPLFQWLKAQRAGPMGIRGIKWNFEKFLVDRDGAVVRRFSTLATPHSIEIHVKRLIG